MCLGHKRSQMKQLLPKTWITFITITVRQSRMFIMQVWWRFYDSLLSVESRVLVTAASMNDICVSLFLVFFVFMLWVESEHLWSTWKWCRGSASSRASQSLQGCWTEMKNCDICYLPWSNAFWPTGVAGWSWHRANTVCFTYHSRVHMSRQTLSFLKTQKDIHLHQENSWTQKDNSWE